MAEIDIADENNRARYKLAVEQTGSIYFDGTGGIFALDEFIACVEKCF